MLARSIAAFAGLLLVPMVAADDTLYFTGQGLSLDPLAGSDVERHALTTRSHGGEPGGRLEWTYQIQQNASILPRNLTFYIEATQPVAVPPAGGAGFSYPGPLDFCPFYIELYTDAYGWWYCRHAFEGSVILPGTYRIDVDFSELDLDRLDVAPGDTLHVLLLTDVVSRDPEPVLYFLSGAKQTDSRVVLDGSNERLAVAPGSPGVGLPTATQGPSTSGATVTDADPSPDGSATADKSAPAFGLPGSALLLAGAAFGVRRRRSNGV